MSNLTEKDIGDAIRLGTTFLLGDVPTDPSTISLTVTDPAGAATTYTYAAAQIIRSSAGVYYKDVSLPTAGEWLYRFIGTGTVESVAQSRFAVRRADA